ncbi:MAG: family 43 glycosylhydrolase, partial [Flavitalea sp.]
MNHLLIACLLISFSASAQFKLNFDAAKESPTKMQYFKPTGNLFVGDCIPFFHKGTYYLYWLLDSAHHSALNGLGGHQWALSTSTDLKTWKHYPVVIGIDEDWEKSICTGSVVVKDNVFYAFYATRLIDKDGKVNEQLSYATSPDGIRFTKQKPNPFYTSAPGYSKRDFRDPKVVVDEAGNFHLFVSSSSDSSITRANGAMVHLVSKDLKQWGVEKPLIVTQDDVPECPDYFEWNGWYYLVYGRGGNTFYLQSKNKYGPWQYPSSQALDEDWTNVVKTAAFTNGRRIAAGWVPSKRDGKDNNGEIFGGNVVIREVIQEKDGSLSTKFAPELIPPTSAAIKLVVSKDPTVRELTPSSFRISSPDGLGAFYFDRVPLNSRISFDATVKGSIEDFGLLLRHADRSWEGNGYKFALSPQNHTASLYNTTIKAVEGVDKKIHIEVVMADDIVDISIGGKRCIVNRLGEKKGKKLVFYAKHGTVDFESIV